MKTLNKHFINGTFQEGSGSRFQDIFNPATGDISGRVCLGTSDDVDRAVAAARYAFEDFSTTSRADRLAMLDAFISVYEKNIDAVAEAIRIEMGAPKSLAERAQAPAGLAHFKMAAKVLKSYEFDRPMGRNMVSKEPIGVVGMITPWNWPINQIACKVAPALAVGCTMVLKPSETTPYSAMLFAEMIEKAGIPKGVFNMVFGEGAVVGEALSAHPDIDMISFTGSGKAGIAVQRTAAATLKRVALELGGKSANIIVDDVDFNEVVRRDTIGVMRNTGQTCVALGRMLVPANRMDQVAAIAADAANSLAVGNPADDKTQIGPIAHKAQFLKVHSLIQKGIEEGAKLVAGGLDAPDGLRGFTANDGGAGGFYVKPTVFSHVTPDMTIAREEIFGPVLSIIGYQDEDQAIRIANDTPYGLSGAVSSANLQTARHIARRLRTGMVHINGASMALDLPFGGYKQSGNGREWGAYGFDEYLEIKSMPGFQPD